ncbi:hypothetical protein SmJEL517_g02574 [Synchytrium microbalum]|uniref:3-hydroxyisobutyryl-CoA hydrolase n=1 Tax=Synchytrium microbalum TaxID=1806994 RepID=A0A507C5Q4_9FUNG|nr:uncharacterized protein SmJEL517_g02574 [Synchytrium microbalum]TPX34831.1 hypothetical protein SmJEL517_g02574 [Synchytrium microbalum]
MFVPFSKRKLETLELVEEHNGELLWIILNRPTFLNSLSPTLTMELHSLLDELNNTTPESRKVRCIILAGNGRGFCAGLDFVAYSKPRPGPVDSLLGQQNFSNLVLKLRRIPQAVISCNQGPTVGGGLGMTLAADVRIGTPSSRFSVGASRLGLTGGECGISFHLPQIVGRGLASEMILTGCFVDAERASKFGLVNHVVPEDKLRETARNMAFEMLSLSPNGLRLSKMELNNWADGMSLSAAIAAEDVYQMYLSATPESSAVSRKFMEKILGSKAAKI